MAVLICLDADRRAAPPLNFVQVVGGGGCITGSVARAQIVSPLKETVHGSAITTFRTTSVYGLTANLKNVRSATLIKPPLEFDIRTAGDGSVTDYLLLRLMTRGDRREYRTLDAGSQLCVRALSGWTSAPLD